ncbi:hypothetical protein [Streptosporangium sp. NPDC004631]
MDNRKVRTAVLGDSRSDHPLFLPEDHHDAELYLTKYKGRTFWCGTWLGGCGWRLVGKLYKDRVCHFAHYPDLDGRAPTCERTHIGEDSADHLYIHRGLSAAFRSARPQRFQGRMTDGQCTDLTVSGPKGRSLIQVQLTNLTQEGWAEADRVLRRGAREVEWVFGQRATLTARNLVDRDGYALRVRCDTKDGARVVQVGTETRDGDLVWNDLNECEISEWGIVTPVLRDARRVHLVESRKRTTGPLGLPLLAEEVTIIPEAAVMKPVGGPGISPGSHAVAAKAVSEPTGRAMTARVVLPDAVDLLVGSFYRLTGPAMANAAWQEDESRVVWTIYARGLTSLVVEEPAVKAVVVQPSIAAATVRVVDDRVPPRDEEWVRANLISLTSRLRKARKTRDAEAVARLLAEVTTLLSVGNRVRLLALPRFRRTREELVELKRWMLAHKASQASVTLATDSKTSAGQRRGGGADPGMSPAERRQAAQLPRTDQRKEWAIRDELYSLLSQMREAKKRKNVVSMADLIARAKRAMVAVPARKFKYELKQIAAHEGWLESFPARRGRVIRSTETDSPVVKVNSQLVSSAIELPEQELIRQRPVERRGELFAPARTIDLANVVRHLLIGAAREQATIDRGRVMDRLAGPVFRNPVDWTAVLVAVDTPAADVLPMLSALITLSDGGVDPAFRQVLEGLGFQVPRTDEVLRLVWEREVERAHTRYASPSRRMPPRLVPRQP